MNKEELKKALDQEQVDPRYYSLNGLDNPSYNDTIILDKENNKWFVYYYERGKKYDMHVFMTEEEACLFLFKWITRNTLTRIYNQRYKT